MKWIAARSLLFALVLAAAAPLAAAERTVDVLTADHVQVEFSETGFTTVYRTIGTGRDVTLVSRILSTTDTDPNVLEGTFELLYSDGFRASGTGSLVVGSLPEISASSDRPFIGFFVLSHLSITATNEPRGGKWPRAGDDLIGAGEFDFDGVFGGTLRIVRTD